MEGWRCRILEVVMDSRGEEGEECAKSGICIMFFLVCVHIGILWPLCTWDFLVTSAKAMSGLCLSVVLRSLSESLEEGLLVCNQVKSATFGLILCLVARYFK